MNFDEIKSNWDNEGSDDVNIPGSITELKRAKHPIDKIKKNMKFEFYGQVLCIITVPFLTQQIFIGSLQELFLGFYAVFVLISAYYFYHFHVFYKQTNLNATSSKDNLYELYYNLRLNMERYKSFGFLLIPFIIGFAALTWIEKPGHLDLDKAMFFGNLITYLTAMIVAVIVYIALIVFWVEMVYGKYTRQIKDILQELKEEN